MSEDTTTARPRRSTQARRRRLRIAAGTVALAGLLGGSAAYAASSQTSVAVGSLSGVRLMPEGVRL